MLKKKLEEQQKLREARLCLTSFYPEQDPYLLSAVLVSACFSNQNLIGIGGQ